MRVRFFTSSTIDNTALPSWADSDNAVTFVSEVLKLEPMEFLVIFEQWATARTRGMSFTLIHLLDLHSCYIQTAIHGRICKL